MDKIEHVYVILVEPKTAGNIGAVARVMKNFGFYRLILVNPVSMDDDAYIRAKHASDILDSAEHVSQLNTATKKFDMVIGTSGIHTDKEKEFTRQAETPEIIANDIKSYHGHSAIIFGREDHGLSNEELKLCDRLVKVPTSEEYPIMNLSHAACVVLYEISKHDLELFELELPGKKAVTSQRERVIARFSDILDSIEYPPHKKEKTEIMFRKILGRANTTRWEYHRLMGVFKYILDDLEKE